MKIANSKRLHRHAVPVIAALALGIVVSGACASSRSLTAASSARHPTWQALVNRSVALSPSQNGWGAMHTVTTQTAPEKATRLGTAALVPKSALLHIALDSALNSVHK